jgi:hypothetical protein
MKVLVIVFLLETAARHRSTLRDKYRPAGKEIGGDTTGLDDVPGNEFHRPAARPQLDRQPRCPRLRTLRPEALRPHLSMGLPLSVHSVWARCKNRSSDDLHNRLDTASPARDIIRKRIVFICFFVSAQPAARILFNNAAPPVFFILLKRLRCEPLFDTGTW